MNFNHLLALYNGERIDRMTVCHLHLDVAKAIRARQSATALYLSPETMEKQGRRHPDLSPEHYRSLRPAIFYGEYRRETDRSAVVLFVDTKFTDRCYRAFVKCTNDGREIYLVSFCLLGDRQHRAELAKKREIIREHGYI